MFLGGHGGEQTCVVLEARRAGGEMRRDTGVPRRGISGGAPNDELGKFHDAVIKVFVEMYNHQKDGAPDPLIYRLALEKSGFAPNEVWHAGDDPKRDWAAAGAAGLEVFQLQRPDNSLRDLLPRLRTRANRRKN